MSANSEQLHYRTCNLCEAMCGIEIKVKAGQIVTIRGDKEDTFSRGHICPKASALQDLHSDPNRLKHPLRRTAQGWERLSWDEAFDEVAKRLQAIQKKYGRNAVGIYAGNPNVHNYGSMMFGPPLFQALKTRNRFSATSADQLPHHFVAFFLFGHQLMLPVPDIDHTHFMLILGANPAVSNGSVMSAPDVINRLKAIRQRGGKLVVIDPRRTETAELADQHHFIRPGSDALLILGILHTLFAENLVKPGRLAPFLEGIERIQEMVTEFSPEVVAPMTGIEAETIRELTRGFAQASSAVCYGRMGVSTQEFGALTQWLITLVNILTGNLDVPGGAMFTLPAFDTAALTAKLGLKGHFAKGFTRVRKLPEFGGEYPVAALAEEIATPGEGQIKAMLTIAGNPVLSAPNGKELDRALKGLEFMVAIDFYLNETTRHAHIILPPTSSLEHENYDLVFHLLAIRNTAKFSPALFAPEPDTRHDWQILQELIVRLQAKRKRDQLTWRLKRRAMQELTPARILDLGLRFGPYGSGANLLGDGLSLRKLEEAPHGVDLGPMKPCLPQRLFTRSKTIRLAQELFLQDLSRLKAKWLSAQPEEGFRLIGRRQLRSNNSWMHNSYRLVKGKERCTLLMHPQDAERQGLQTQQKVRVSSRVGSLEIPLEITDEMMPGIVSIPHGWGHHLPGVQLDVAQKHPGVSLNDITDQFAIDALCGNAAFNGIPVRIEALTNERAG